MNFYQALRDAAENDGTIGTWHVLPTEEVESVVVEQEGVRVAVCAGRQVATHERLEVLALGTAEQFPDGSDVLGTMRDVRERGGIPVVPWGFGKWLGARRAVLAKVLNAWTESGERIFLGDNGNRLRGRGRPRQFRETEEQGGLVLAGSDPLPFRSHEARAGSYGFLMGATLDPDRPASSVKQYLLTAAGPLPSYGGRAGIGRFLTDQAALQVRKHLQRS